MHISLNCCIIYFGDKVNFRLCIFCFNTSIWMNWDWFCLFFVLHAKLALGVRMMRLFTRTVRLPFFRNLFTVALHLIILCALFNRALPNIWFTSWSACRMQRNTYQSNDCMQTARCSCGLLFVKTNFVATWKMVPFEYVCQSTNSGDRVVSVKGWYNDNVCVSWRKIDVVDKIEVATLMHKLSKCVY